MLYGKLLSYINLIFWQRAVQMGTSCKLCDIWFNSQISEIVDTIMKRNEKIVFYLLIFYNKIHCGRTCILIFKVLCWLSKQEQNISNCTLKCLLIKSLLIELEKHYWMVRLLKKSEFKILILKIINNNSILFKLNKLNIKVSKLFLVLIWARGL